MARQPGGAGADAGAGAVSGQEVQRQPPFVLQAERIVLMISREGCLSPKGILAR